MKRKKSLIPWSEIFGVWFVIVGVAGIESAVFWLGHFAGLRAAYAIQLENTNIAISCPYAPPFKVCESETTTCDGSKWNSYEIKDGVGRSFYCSNKNEAVYLSMKLNKKP